MVMIMKTKGVLLVLFLCMVMAPVYSQEYSLSEVKTQLNALFANLDKTKVPTGYLWDTAVNLVEREEYNGTSLTDSNYVSISLMGDMLYSINSASVGADTICTQAAIARLQRNSNVLQQMVGLLFQPYNYIVENALTDNLIMYSNDRVSDSYIGGVWQNPYAEDALFGFAVGKESEVSLNTTFIITNIDSLSTRTFQSILFDPGDGGGFRSVSMGGTVAASYDESGYYETKLKVICGGREYQSHGLVYAHPTQHNNASSSSTPKDTITIFAQYGGMQYKALVCSNTPRCFNNPLIVAEGFDPWRLLNESKDHSYSGITCYSNFIADSSFDSSSYDVFYIDWYDYGADIRANAEVLKAVIRWVNDNKSSESKNIVLGQSMGGLIARYALRDMELRTEPHDTKLFISHDVPYSGANVSPGLLFAYRDLYDIADNLIGQGYSLFGKKRSSFNELRRFGSYMSVRQMLPNYVNSAWHYDNNYFNQFQTELATMGFPHGDPGSPIENVAIINGGNTSSGAPSFFSSTDKLVSIQIKVSTGLIPECVLIWPNLLLIGYYSNNLSLWIPGKSTLQFSYSIYPYLLNNTVIASSSLVFTKKFLWLIEKKYTLKNSSFSSPPSGVPFDAVRSSFYAFDREMMSFIPEPESSSNLLWGDYEYSFELTDKLMFIPMASAFASTDFSRDFRANHPNPITQTPFTSYVLPDTTTEHISFFDSINYWLETIEDVNISGPILPQSGAVYSIPPAYASSFQWSTSNSSIATINSSGELSINGFGIVDVIATKENTNYVISKRKRVLVGLPRMALFANHSGTQWSVSAECIDEGVEEFISSSGLTDSLMHKWYLIINGVTVDSTFNNSNSVMWCVADTVRNATVSLIISCGSRTTTPVFLTLKDNRNYLFNVYEIRTPGLFCIYEVNAPYIYDTDNPPYFKLTNNPDDPNTNTWPKRLKATAGNVIKRTYGDLTIIDNHLVWDLFSDPDIESLCSTGAISDITIDIYRDTIETNDYLVQTIVIPVVLFDPLELWKD